MGVQSLLTGVVLIVFNKDATQLSSCFVYATDVWYFITFQVNHNHSQDYPYKNMQQAGAELFQAQHS